MESGAQHVGGVDDWKAINLQLSTLCKNLKKSKKKPGSKQRLQRFVPKLIKKMQTVSAMDQFPSDPNLKRSLKRKIAIIDQEYAELIEESKQSKQSEKHVIRQDEAPEDRTENLGILKVLSVLSEALQPLRNFYGKKTWKTINSKLGRLNTICRQLDKNEKSWEGLENIEPEILEKIDTVKKDHQFLSDPNLQKSVEDQINIFEKKHADLKKRHGENLHLFKADANHKESHGHEHNLNALESVAKSLQLLKRFIGLGYRKIATTRVAKTDSSGDTKA